MVHDALNSPQTIEAVLISSSVIHDPKIIEIQKQAQKKGARVQMVKPNDLTKYSESRNPQGVVAFMVEPEQPGLEQILKEKETYLFCFLMELIMSRIWVQYCGLLGGLELMLW